MRVDFFVSGKSVDGATHACEALVRSIGRGTKAATIEAGQAIVARSSELVPVDTGALAQAVFLGVARRTDVKRYVYGAVIGYGEPMHALDADLGPVQWLIKPTNAPNPKSGKPPSTYAMQVHEDLNAYHPKGGDAKFLETAIREYAEQFTRVAEKHWLAELKATTKGGAR